VHASTSYNWGPSKSLDSGHGALKPDTNGKTRTRLAAFWLKRWIYRSCLIDSCETNRCLSQASLSLGHSDPRQPNPANTVQAKA
jgi:hypothetical protein